MGRRSDWIFAILSGVEAMIVWRYFRWLFTHPWWIILPLLLLFDYVVTIVLRYALASRYANKP